MILGPLTAGLTLPLTPVSYLCRRLRGDRPYKTSTFGRLAAELDSLIKELAQKSFIERAILYAPLSNAWLFSAAIAHFQREKPEVVVEKMNEIVNRLLKKLDDIQVDIKHLSGQLEKQYACLENEVSVLEKIQGEHLTNLKSRCDLLRDIQKTMQSKIDSKDLKEAAEISNWSQAKEFFRDTQEQNETWLRKIATLEGKIDHKSHIIVACA